jgi:hypothetical protein
MARSQWRVALILCGAVFALNSAIAGPKEGPQRVDGVVVNKEGKPVPDAEVRADSTDSAVRFVTRTNADGKYVFASLPEGKYSITVVSQNGHSEARFATVGLTSDNGQPIRRFISALPYQVKPDYRGGGSAANVRARYVWQPGETGSHIGGRWIKAQDVAPSTNPLEIIVGNDLNHSPSLRVNSSAK